jgi:D-3-phosphoglycerate dehydrogenase
VPDILISENIRGAAVDALAERFSVVTKPDLWRDAAAMEAEIPNYRALIVRNQTKVSRSLLERASQLAVVGRAGVGLDNVDLDACADAGISLVSTPEQNSISVAELAIGLMISLARFLNAADLDTKAGNWNRPKFWGTELYGRTFGIVGAGKIGLLAARRAQAFGMKILAHDPYISRDNVFLAEVGAELVSLDELLERADVVSCHLPATPQTNKILNAEAFARMKPTALFLNTSRGEVVDEDALIAALKSKQIAAAALDVRAVEPPKPSELDTLPNVLLTPHIAALTNEAQDRVTRAICEDIGRVLDGKKPMNAVPLPPPGRATRLTSS